MRVPEQAVPDAVLIAVRRIYTVNTCKYPGNREQTALSYDIRIIIPSVTVCDSERARRRATAAVDHTVRSASASFSDSE
jgi:hypothetical protein